MRTFSYVALALAGCAQSTVEEAPDGSARECRPDSRRCLNSASQVCTSDGLWSVPQPCRSGFSCLDGLCTVDCDDGCAVGAVRCTPDGTQRCESDDGCGRWAAPRPCASGAVCEGGRCVDDCVPCAPDERRCAGAGAYTRCVDADCPTWGDSIECDPGAVCSGGACVADGACEDRCQAGMATCVDASHEQRCEAQASGCLDWSEPTACAPDARCVLGSGCDEGCGPAPCVADQTRCVDGGVQRCTRDARDCAVWGAIEDCGAAGDCVDGECRATCERACEPDARRCVEGGVQTCRAEGECTDWSDPVPCARGTSCAGAGECRACDPGEQEVRPCARCGTQRRACTDGAWTEWGECGEQGACEPGASEACGACGLRTCHGRCEWGGCEAAGECAPGDRRDCGQCGFQLCTDACTWSDCGNGDGTTWRHCNQCGWQFCCPNGSWCDCAARFADRCDGAECVDDGVCR